MNKIEKIKTNGMLLPYDVILDKYESKMNEIIDVVNELDTIVIQMLKLPEGIELTRKKEIPWSAEDLKVGDWYATIHSSGTVGWNEWRNDVADQWNRIIGNCYPDFEEAKAAKDRKINFYEHKRNK